MSVMCLRHRAWLRQASMAATAAKPQVSRVKKMRGMFPRLTTLDLCKVGIVAALRLSLFVIVDC